MVLTEDQKDALVRKFHQNDQGMTYKKFRDSAQPTIGCDGAVAVLWCGMWLCIETDGYTHS